MSRTDKKEYKDWKGFGERTKKARESIGLTREKMSEMIDRTENYVLSLEKGDKSCSIHTLHQIFVALRESSDNLLYGENMNNNKEYTNKEILKNIIDKCDEEELMILKDIILATFPNLSKIKTKRKD